MLDKRGELSVVTMRSAHIALLVLLSTTGCNAELPKTTPQCSKDWGGWWDAYNCGTYKVHWAVASGNMNLTKSLLDAGWDINLEDERMWTPIIEAAFFGKQHLSIELVRRGADLSARGYLGINVVKVAKLKWCIMHSSVNTCPTTLYDYDFTIEVLFRGCEWTECVDGFRCVGRQCWPDKCHKVECDPNASCVVENRKPVCRCNPGFVKVDPNNTKCEEISGKGKSGLKSGSLVLDPCPEGYYIFGSQCLYIDDLKKLSWKDAAKRCKRKNGVLARIENPGNFSSYLDEFYPKMSFWVGGNDKKKEGVWRWYSGELLPDSFPWGVNQGGKQQPNDGGNNEDCMTIKYFNPELKTQYVDNKCTLRHYYVCTAPRNYVDDVPTVSNSVYPGIEVNSTSTDEAVKRVNINSNMEGESSSSSNGKSLNSNIGEDNNSTESVTQTMTMAINRIKINNVVVNDTNNNENAAKTGTSRILQGQEEDINVDNERVSSNVNNERDSNNVNSVTRNINQNDRIGITSKYIRNMTETNNERLVGITSKYIRNITETSNERLK